MLLKFAFVKKLTIMSFFTVTIKFFKVKKLLIILVM